MALQAEIIEVSPYRLWLPLGHPLAGADIIGISDIAREPLIMLTVDEIEENTGKLLIALGASPHVAFRTRSVEAVRSLVATGAGIALLPDLVYRPWSLEGDRIESRDISGSLPVVQVGMVWRRGSGLPQAARDFIGIAQAQRTVASARRSQLPIGNSDIAFLINEFAKSPISASPCRQGSRPPLECGPCKWENRSMKSFLKSCTALTRRAELLRPGARRRTC